MKFKDKLFATRDKHIAQAIADKYPHDTMSIPFDAYRDDPSGTHKYHFGLHKLGNWKDRIDWSK